MNKGTCSISAAEYRKLIKKIPDSTKSGGNPFSQKENKYRNTEVNYDGKIFPSEKEANRYAELKILERAGKISDLQTQVKFELIPTQTVNGKVVEQKCCYLADFVYKDSKGNTVVEDTKGLETPGYVIKRKLMLFLKGIRIVQI